MPYLGNDLTSIVKQGKTVYEYVATAGQTVFTGNDSNSVSLDITTDTFVSVFLNGIRLIVTDDYTVSTNTITLTSAASLNDELIIVADIEAATFNTYTKSETDAKIVELSPPLDLSAVDESIIPDTDVTYDIGSSSRRFRDLYLSGNTIYLGSSYALSYDATNNALKSSRIQLPDISSFVPSSNYTPGNNTQNMYFNPVASNAAGSNIDGGSGYMIWAQWGFEYVAAGDTLADNWNAATLASRTTALAYTSLNGDKAYIWTNNDNSDTTNSISNINAVNNAADPLVDEEWDITFDLTAEVATAYVGGGDLIAPVGSTFTVQITYGHNTPDLIAANNATPTMTIANSGTWAYDLPNLSTVETTIVNSSSITSLIAGKASLTTGTTEPSSPSTGDLWYDTSGAAGVLKIWNGSAFADVSPVPPAITSINVSEIAESDGTQTIVITGTDFDTGASAILIGNNGTTYTPTTSTRNSSTQITMVFSGGDVITDSAAEPLDVKVTNGTNLSNVLSDALTINNSPAWSTSAGNLGTVYEDVSGSSFTVAATDPEGSSITYSVESGALPTGMSLNTSSGVIDGTPNVNDAYNSAGVTHNFGIGASDGSNTVNRSFNIIRKWYDGSTSALAAPSGTYIYDLTGTTTDGLYWIKPTNYSGSALQCRVWMSNSSYGRGATLVASYSTLNGFRQDQNTGGRNVSYINSTINPFSSQHNSNGPSVYPKTFVNALVADSTTNHTMGGIVSTNSGTTYFQFRGISETSKGTTGAGYDMWYYMYATGAMNNNTQIRISGRLNSNNSPSGQISDTSWTFGSWYTYNGGRGASDGTDSYHYMPDDETGGGEWWFRENIDDSCHQAYGRAGNDLAFVW